MVRKQLNLSETIEAAILQGRIDEAVRETLAKSDDEIREELEAEGIDVDALDERLRARGERLFGRKVPPG